MELNLSQTNKKCLILMTPKREFREKKKRRRKKIQKCKKDKYEKAKFQKILLKGPKKELEEEFYQSFTNNIDFEYFNKKIPSKKDGKTFLLEDDFLNSIEQLEFIDKMNDLNYGDFCITFPNPDSEKIKNRKISLKEAINIYDTQLFVLNDDIPLEENYIEKSAFIKAFLSLDDFLTKEEEEKLMNEKSEENKIENLPKIIVQNTSKSQLFIKEDFIDIELENILGNEISQALKISLKKSKGNPLLEKFIEEKKRLKENISKDPFFNINIEDEKYSLVQKKFSQGGFLDKIFIPDTPDFDWVCTNERPKDFLTLLRFFIASKLVKRGNFSIRFFITEPGDIIFMTFKASDSVLIREAENKGINKQLEIGKADLFSLEPVDDKGRPLRIKKFVRNPDLIEEIIEEEEEEWENEKKENEGNENFPKERSKIKAVPQLSVSKIRSLYKKVRNMPEKDFKKNINKKQRMSDYWIKEIAKESKTNMDLETGEILGDCKVVFIYI